MGARDILKTVPMVGPSVFRLQQAVQNRLLRFNGSSDYWERRYRSGGDSGAGSSGRLAEFKADVLNRFVEDNGVRTVLELGCGDGAQLAATRYPRYLGVDVSPTVVRMCRTRFRNDPTKEFLLLADLSPDLQTDLVLSLDVIYHLVEDEVFESYMATLFDHAGRYVIIYSSDEDRPHSVPHVRHRRFSAWVEQHRPDWRLRTRIPNPYPYDRMRPYETSFADFFVYEKAG